MTDYLKFKKCLATFKPSGRGMVYIVPEFSTFECVCNNARQKMMIRDRDKQIEKLLYLLDKTERKLKKAI